MSIRILKHFNSVKLLFIQKLKTKMQLTIIFLQNMVCFQIRFNMSYILCSETVEQQCTATHPQCGNSWSSSPLKRLLEDIFESWCAARSLSHYNLHSICPVQNSWKKEVSNLQVCRCNVQMQWTILIFRFRQHLPWPFLLPVGQNDPQSLCLKTGTLKCWTKSNQIRWRLKVKVYELNITN